MQILKEYWQKIPDKTKKLLIAITAGTAVIAIIGILALNFGVQKDYSTLFTGLNQEEAQEVVALLQDDGIDYRYNSKNGEIRVSSAAVDQTRAVFLSMGYPKSGFTYDMYRDNTGLMTTESDKKQYTLYDLQDRLGAQIRLFDGVSDAKVTIADAVDQKYALSDSTAVKASASVVVTMKNGRNLSGNEASAIKNLIARAVQGMTFTNVAVFDAETMLEIGGSEGDGSYAAARDLTSLTSLVESNMAANVRRVLEKLYGQGTVAVSAKGTLNMARLIQESTQYTVPEKLNEQDKTGLLYQEDSTSEYSGTGSRPAAGVVGADANADVPRYTNQDTTEDNEDSYTNNRAAREWLYNTVKEQRQVDPGVLDNISIGIVIDTEDLSIPNEDLIELVANSTGISKDEAQQKITIIRARSPGSRRETAAAVPVGSGQTGSNEGFSLPPVIIIAMIAGAVLILLLLIMLMINRNKKRRKGQDEVVLSAAQDEADDFPERALKAFKSEDRQTVPFMDEELDRNEEILNLRMQHSLKLKQNIGEFVEQNPQIAAKLVQTWLNGKE